MIYKLRDTFLEDGFYVTQNYMARPEYYKQFNLLGHEGVDFGHTDKKRQIRSPLSGTVFVSYDKNYGNYAVIEDYKQQCAVYLCHLENVVVVSGQEVTAGDPIGEMGQSGNSTGEHCHCNFLILKDGSNKYRAKKWNWGYLDLLYPRDTGATQKFDGVEDYTIQWGEGSTPTNTQLSECEVHKNNLQTQVNGLVIDVDTLKGKLSDAETKIGTANGRVVELTKQNEDLSIKLGSAINEAKHNLDEVKKRDEIISSLNETIEKINKTDNFASTATDAQDELSIVKNQYSLTLYEAEELLKLSHPNDTIQNRAVIVLDAIERLRASKEIPLDLSDYLFVIKVGSLIWKK